MHFSSIHSLCMHFSSIHLLCIQFLSINLLSIRHNRLKSLDKLPTIWNLIIVVGDVSCPTSRAVKSHGLSIGFRLLKLSSRYLHVNDAITCISVLHHSKDVIIVTVAYIELRSCVCVLNWRGTFNYDIGKNGRNFGAQTLVPLFLHILIGHGVPMQLAPSLETFKWNR